MEPSNPSFVFFGTPSIASNTLATLMEHGHVPSVVVTSPDARRGRGMLLTPSPTREYAEAHNIRVLTPEKITPEVIETLRAYGCTYALVVAYGKILPQALIDIYPKGILNIHYSLLPKYRGASPVESALLHGEATTGVSIQKMVKALDAGDVLTSKAVAIAPTETIRELRPRLIKEGSDLLLATLPSFLGDTATFTPQNPDEVTTCGKIAKEQGELHLDESGLKNWNTYRAFVESPGTYFYIQRGEKRQRVKIKTATYSDTVFTPLRVVPEGKAEMNYTDLIR